MSNNTWKTIFFTTLMLNFRQISSMYILPLYFALHQLEVLDISLVGEHIFHPLPAIYAQINEMKSMPYLKE
jgi:hypothetical protein